MNTNKVYRRKRNRKPTGSILILVLTLALMVSGSFMNPIGAYAAMTRCDKGIYNNGLDGINININAAPYNTIFTDRNIQKNAVNVAYDDDGCGWFASARARQLTGKDIKYIWAADNWWNRYSQFGFGRIAKGSGIPKGKSIAVWYKSATHPYGHVAIVEKVNGNTITLSEGGAWNGWFSSRPNLKPYGYCVLRRTTRSAMESMGRFMGYIDLKVGGEIVPTGLSINSSLSVPVKGTGQISLAYKPSNVTASKKGVVWTSSNVFVALVDKNGKVTGITPGTATITATSVANTKVRATCKVTVTSPKKVRSTSVSINKRAITILAGYGETLTASVNPSNAANKSIRWTTSNSGVATVSSSGRVIGVAPGTATITATAGDGYSKTTCSVTVLLGNGVYKLKHVGTGKMMNYAWGWKEFAYKPIFLYQRDGSVEQTFRFRHISGGKYEIDIMHKEGGVMNVWTAKTVAAGQKIGSWSKTYDDTQRFLVTFVGKNTIVLRSAQNSGLAVAPDGSARGYLKLVKYNPSDRNQQWVIER